MPHVGVVGAFAAYAGSSRRVTPYLVVSLGGFQSTFSSSLSPTRGLAGLALYALLVLVWTLQSLFQFFQACQVETQEFCSAVGKVICCELL